MMLLRGHAGKRWIHLLGLVPGKYNVIVPPVEEEGSCAVYEFLSEDAAWVSYSDVVVTDGRNEYHGERRGTRNRVDGGSRER